MRVDKKLVNTMNKATVIELLRKNDRTFKAELSRMTRLSQPTILKIIDELDQKNLITQLGLGQSTGGKMPDLIGLNCHRHHIVGVDVGSTRILAVIINLQGEIIYSDENAVSATEGQDVVIAHLIDIIQKTLTIGRERQCDIIGVGIGMPGLIDQKKGNVVFSPNFGWENVPLLSRLQQKISLPIRIDNVSRTMACGEKYFGDCGDLENFVCVNIGHGIGAALMVNGELYSGSSFTAGEFGHFSVRQNGRICECGNRGCLQSIASGNAIAKTAREFVESGMGNEFLQAAHNDINAIDAKIVFDLAAKNNPAAIEIVKEVTHYLGISLANLINLLDPDAIVITGGVSKAKDTLIQPLAEEIRNHQMRYAGRSVRVFVSRLGDNCAAIGAAAMIMKEFIENGGEMLELM